MNLKKYEWMCIIKDTQTLTYIQNDFKLTFLNFEQPIVNYNYTTLLLLYYQNNNYFLDT